MGDQYQQGYLSDDCDWYALDNKDNQNGLDNQGSYHDNWDDQDDWTDLDFQDTLGDLDDQNHLVGQVVKNDQDDCVDCDDCDGCNDFDDCCGMIRISKMTKMTRMTRMTKMTKMASMTRVMRKDMDEYYEQDDQGGWVDDEQDYQAGHLIGCDKKIRDCAIFSGQIVR